MGIVCGEGRRGEVRHEGGAMGVDLCSGKAEVRVVGVEANPKFFRFDGVSGCEGSRVFGGVIGEGTFLE